MKYKIWSLVLIGLLISQVSYAQQKKNDLLKVYFEANAADKAYILKTLPYITLVRDPNVSDVQILQTSVGTASGGREYTFEFIGREDYADIGYKLKYTANQEATRQQRREGIVKLVEYGLVPYGSQSFDFENIKVDIDGVEESVASTEPEKDPWNNWVFQLSGSGSFFKDANYKRTRMNGRVRGNRITEDWKIKNDIEYSKSTNVFKDGNDEIYSYNVHKSIEHNTVKTLTGKWSTGIHGKVFSSTFLNKTLSYRLAPAIEYNFFPWTEVSSREFTVAYRMGVWVDEYIDMNIYGDMDYMSGYHNMQVNLKVIKKWGEAGGRINGFQYFSNPEFYSMGMEAWFDARVTKNLSLNLWSRFKSIHDQIYLAAGDASLEDLLLQQRSIATTYQYSFGCGVNYRFGSIYNNVINYRL